MKYLTIRLVIFIIFLLLIIASLKEKISLDTFFISWILLVIAEELIDTKEEILKSIRN